MFSQKTRYYAIDKGLEVCRNKEMSKIVPAFKNMNEQ